MKLLIILTLFSMPVYAQKISVPVTVRVYNAEYLASTRQETRLNHVVNTVTVNGVVLKQY